MNDKVYIARPNYELLDAVIMFGGFYGAAKLIDWLTEGVPAWLNWLLLPVELALCVFVVYVAYHMTTYKECDGDYDKCE